MLSCRESSTSGKIFAKVLHPLGFLGPRRLQQATNTALPSPAGGNAVVDGCGKAQQGAELAAEEHEEYALMSIDTIINGKVGSCAPTACRPADTHRQGTHGISCFVQEGVFPGLIPILNSYLENMEVDVDTRCSILNYLKLIKKRASGMVSFAFFKNKSQCRQNLTILKYSDS